MTLNYPIHKALLLQILKDIYSDTSISPYLGFKGGTAAHLFYGLDRDSVDLDFDFLDESKEQVVFEHIQKIAAHYGKVVDARIKRFTILSVISYNQKAQNIKIEVNRRKFSSRYELKDALGISMLVMVREDMLANKLLAMHDRVGKTSRDIYDVWFFFKHNWPVNRKIIIERAGMSYREFLEKCIFQIEKMPKHHILDGLGELLTQSQKDWVRNNLQIETIFLLKVQIEMEKEIT